MSQPAAMHRGTASLRAMTPAMPIMCEASEMMSPLKPSSPRSRSFSSSGAREAGISSASVRPGRTFRLQAGKLIWPVITASRPSSIIVR